MPEIPQPRSSERRRIQRLADEAAAQLGRPRRQVATPPVTDEWRALVNTTQAALDRWREHLRTRENQPMPVGDDGLGDVERALLAALDALLPVLRRDTSPPETYSRGGTVSGNQFFITAGPGQEPTTDTNLHEGR